MTNKERMNVLVAELVRNDMKLLADLLMQILETDKNDCYKVQTADKFKDDIHEFLMYAEASHEWQKWSKEQLILCKKYSDQMIKAREILANLTFSRM